MKPIIKIVHYYEDGTEEVFKREHQYGRRESGIRWAKRCRRNKQEQEEVDKEMQEIIARLRKVDVSIFPDKLF